VDWPTKVAAPPAEHPVLQLQRVIGNRAVTAALGTRAVRKPSGTGRLSSLLAGVGAQAGGRVAARDQRAEAEADRVADAAVDRLGGRSNGAALSGGALHPSLRNAIASVAPGIGPLGQIKFRTDDVASASADNLGARAFAHGSEVSVRRGELEDPVEGPRLAAHEAVHSARHPVGEQTAGRPLVHAKLRGTRGALESQGGGTTSGSLRKFFGKLTNWDKILAGVGAYEQMEESLLAAGNATRQQVAQVAPRFITQLMKIQGDSAAWAAANGGAAQAGMGDAIHAKDKANRSEPGDDYKKPEADPRSKSARRQAISQLTVRVSSEIADLRSGHWADTLGLSDAKVDASKGEGREDKGQKNVVKELHYATESGEFSGYFKGEKGFNEDPEPHELEAGIRQTDPNYGARSVASYRLDRLFGAGVTARAEFAVHNGKLGTVLETAKGHKMDELLMEGSEEARLRPGQVTTSMSDPVLQQAFNKLQLFDAICGQLDRHQGNFRVNTTESGKVTGVTGIDLDMSFGSDMGDTESMKANAPNYAGLPELIDREFGESLLSVNEGDVRGVLAGLLSPSEIDATVARFLSVQAKVAEVKASGQLVHTWDESTASQQRDYKKRWGFEGAAGYSGQALNSEVIGAYDNARTVMNAMNRAIPEWPRQPFREELRRHLSGLPQPTAAAFGRALASLVPGDVKTWVENGTVPPDKAVDFAIELCNELLGDDHVLAQIEVALQDEPGDGSEKAKSMLGPRYQAIFSGVLHRFATGRVLAGV
jgi:hypothetical protein